MVYFLLSISLLILFLLVYYRYKKLKDKRELFGSIFYILVAIFFTYFLKVVYLHKALFVFHLAALILSWSGVFLYLIKGRKNLFMIFAPSITALFFILGALFFREFG